MPRTRFIAALDDDESHRRPLLVGAVAICDNPMDMPTPTRFLVANRDRLDNSVWTGAAAHLGLHGNSTMKVLLTLGGSQPTDAVISECTIVLWRYNSTIASGTGPGGLVPRRSIARCNRVERS
jgi:hypothetical protein